MAHEPIQAVAGPGERIDNRDCRAGKGMVEDTRNVLADQVSQLIPDGFERRAGEHANPPTIPLCRRHPVDAHILGVSEAIDAELLDLPQLHNLVPLAVTQ
jgi:hypothetical protein